MTSIISNTSQSFLRLPEVLRITGKSRTALYDAVKNQEFPAQVRIGKRQVAWSSTAIEKWQQACIQASKA
jgi:prophage regulatory protein